MLKKVKTHANIRRIDLLVEPFIPIGFNTRKQRVGLRPGALWKNPARYVNNNGMLIIAAVLYDAIHQGPEWWTLFHIALLAPSLYVLYTGLRYWIRQNMAEE